ncbi:hypothetical protein EV356DRAFT_502678 [Viridothelium virens]|uniref:Uncharacterized protein n=1 Tax=Viridothelium virens TaxID=1048519 RepID=A0A6A6H876_VIRVR|nr:hypothetical protein EV356DRAFT_502678 [Viridothelium virens]
MANLRRTVLFIRQTAVCRWELEMFEKVKQFTTAHSALSHFSRRLGSKLDDDDAACPVAGANQRRAAEGNGLFTFHHARARTEGRHQNSSDDLYSLF